MLKDQDIREPLFEYLEMTYGKVRIIEEKTMGKSRADVVMVLPNCLVGIEIKSDADTYTRLKRQIKDYDKYFDSNIIVVGSHHGKHVKEHVPAYWGIITVELVDDKVDLYVMREPESNPKRIYKKKMEILWKNELAQLLAMENMPKYTSKSKSFIVDKLLERHESNSTLEQLDCAISNILFERDYNFDNKPKEDDRKHYCYMLRCNDNSLYTGYAVNPINRLKQHNSGRGAKYTRFRTPCELVYVEEFDTKQDAMKREYEIKHSMTKKKKEQLIVDNKEYFDKFIQGGK